MDNRIQVFGLKRSGTNFVEWSLVHNFKNLEYKNVYSTSDVEGDVRYNEFDALKHCYPTLDRSEFAIVIYKEYDIWKVGYKSHTGHKAPNKKIYDKYLDTAKSLDNDKVYIVNHSYMVKNYVKTLKEISTKFDIELNDTINQPMNRLNRDGASTSQTSKKFKL